ncbi:aminoglycoside phosphotransferase [Pectinatus sottacetonis]|uniref:aminoglycoside phosphotransferase n=1 Tax=Pectinatus sottacetonis TaxID=1002795 RepID=UPI0018C824B7|nr:aminoglycoside phosphotransferase [Pectinatus sottacetonis]
MADEIRQKIQKRIEELKKRMNYDANDLEYETHLHIMRDLQQILDNSGKKNT